VTGIARIKLDEIGSSLNKTRIWTRSYYALFLSRFLLCV